MPDLAPVGNLLKADELIMLQRVMKVDARIQFYVDDTPNAVALPKKPTEAFDGTILVGVNMISKVPTDYDYTALYGVIGHESSHLLQYARNPEWISGGKAPELHADFMGGYYIAVRTWRYHQLTLNRDAFGALLFALGDCDFSNPLHHGTPDERRDAMEAGYEVARSNPGVSVDEAYRAGLSWLSR